MKLYVPIMLAAVVLIALAGLAYTMYAGNHQRKKDTDASHAASKHKVMFNPAIWPYVVMIGALIVGAYVFYRYAYGS